MSKLEQQTVLAKCYVAMSEIDYELLTWREKLFMFEQVIWLLENTRPL